MSAKGYATTNDVQTEYGQALTAAQMADALLWLEVAERRIDHEAGQAWLTGAVTERHWVFAPWLSLRSAAATGVTAVRAYAYASRTATTLTADTDYWLEGTTLHLPAAPHAYDRIEVDYTPPQTVPAPIRWATAALVADWLQRQGSAEDVASVALGTMRVQFREPPATPTLPSRVQDLVALYRAPVTVA